ncbi:hypothetical protein Glove_51g97 [Diversispora epigaea]|uniref:Uncharacterized protein n=1 Tax=Diversispora epigaea TaxID=1348612 RepID=A0A397JDH7_9GLOM|nr:hypothetical protein Glove_51g97 [Diversispora epigaea]
MKAIHTSVYCAQQRPTRNLRHCIFTCINASLSLPTSHSYLLALYAHFGTRNTEMARRYWKHGTENTLALMKEIHIIGIFFLLQFRLDTGKFRGSKRTLLAQ